jgi:hypothetical protein
MVKKKKYFLNRTMFMLWVDGMLLERTGLTCIVADQAEFERAEKELEKGTAQVFLTVNGVVRTEMICSDDGFYEREL